MLLPPYTSPPFLPIRSGCLPESMPRDRAGGGPGGQQDQLEDRGFREETGHLEDQMYKITKSTIFLGRRLAKR